jgi:hypothetical protein
MGSGRSKQSKETLALLETHRAELEESREAIYQSRKFVAVSQTCMHQILEDNDVHYQSMKKKRAELNQLLCQARTNLNQSQEVLSRVANRLEQLPPPAPDLINIHGHLLDRNLIYRAYMERYVDRYHHDVACVILVFTDRREQKIAADILENEAMILVDSIFKSLTQKSKHRQEGYFRNCADTDSQPGSHTAPSAPSITH